MVGKLQANRQFAFVTIVLLGACGGGSPQAPQSSTPSASRATAIIVEPSTAVVRPGETLRFTGRPVDRDGYPVTASVIWRAEGGAISADGVYVAGPSAGTYVVTVESDPLAVRAQARIIIEPPLAIPTSPAPAPAPGPGPAPAPVPTTISLAPDFVELEFGQSIRFEATVLDQNGNPMTAVVSWDASGGLIDNATFVAGNTAGTFDVTARAGDLLGRAAVLVVRPPRVPAAITVEPSAVDLDAGSAFQFSATVLDQFGDALNAPVAWSATAGSIDANGRFAAPDESGNLDVVAGTGDIYARAVVAVRVPPSEGNSIDTGEVPIRPGDSIQAAVDANPAGTVFRILAGTHRRQSVVPRDGQSFVGEAGAILDGGHATRRAFSGLARDVTIRGLIIENYASKAQEGAIHAGGGSAGELSIGWVVEFNEIRNNAGTGVRTGHAIRVAGNHVHHNGQLGIGGLGDDIVIEGNEIAYNNYQRTFSYGWEAGGAKFVKTRNLVVRGNHSHHNWGPGLWTDIDNINTLYEDNLVEDNADTGIFHEISYSAVIRNNTVRRNGFDRAGDWAYGAGILVAHSPDVQVLNNIVEHNQNGILGIQQSRGSGAHGAHRLDNFVVRGNHVTQDNDSWAAGAVQDIGDRAVFQRNIVFEGNRYDLGGDDRYFAWNDGSRHAATWTGYGHDTTGVFNF